MNDTASPQLQLTLNPNGVSAPIRGVVTVSSQVVALTLKALDQGEFRTLALQGPIFGFHFNSTGLSDEDRLRTYRNWILVKGFQELARGIRETLEEAVCFIEIAKMGVVQTTVGEFNEKMAGIRRRAGKASFPQLIERVNHGLHEKMAFSDEFAMSLQRVRNCLEHRAGWVGPDDVDAETAKLVITFPRFRMFYKRGADEIELAMGEALDTEDVDDEGNVQIYLGRLTKTREFSLGEKIMISEEDFAEISMACMLFADDLVLKLPQLPSPNAI